METTVNSTINVQMTYSICVTDGTRHGIAIATKAPAVGGLAPFLSRNGAVCTQSIVNVPLGPKVVQLLDGDASVDDAVATLLEKDDDAPLRQVHGIDKWGNKTTFSGEDCVDWFGSRTGDDYSIAGNMLEGAHVLEAIADTYEETTDQPLEERLLDALRAGEDAGGDKRAGNAQSAALKVYDPDNPRLYHDLRVDDHEDPVAELRRVYQVAREDNEQWDEEFPEADLQRTL